MKAVLEELRRLLFGDDIFVSYSRSDAADYAIGLAAALEGFTCFLDQVGTEKGAEMPESLLEKIRLSTIFVLVASDGAIASSAVERELREFDATSRPIVTIDFGTLERAPWYPELIEGRAKSFEETAALEGGDPSAAVLERIGKSFTYTRRSDVIRRLFWGTLAFIGLAVVGTAGWATRAIGKVTARAAVVERGTRVELGRTASLLSSSIGDERQALAAGLQAVRPGAWDRGDPPAQAVYGLTEAVDAASFSLPVVGELREVRRAAFSEDGTLLIAETSEGTSAWSAVSGKPAAVPASIPESSEPSDRPAVELAGESAKLIDAESGEAVVFSGHTGRITHYAWSPGGGRLATSSEDGTVRVWLRNGRQMCLLDGHSKEEYFETYLPLDYRPSPFQKTGGSIIRHPARGVNHVAFSPDGTLLASAGNDRTAVLWDLRYCGKVNLLGGHRLQVRFADFSPSGSYLATASDDGEVRLWEGHQGRPLAVLPFHRSRVELVAFSTDEIRLATFAADGTARIWRPFRDVSLLTLDGHEGHVGEAHYSPDGRWVATSGQSDGTTIVWEAAGGRRVATLRDDDPSDGLTRLLREATATPSATADRLAWVDPATPRHRFGLPPPQDPARPFATRAGMVSGAVFSPKGDLLLSYHEGAVILWKVDSWESLVRFDRHQDNLSSSLAATSFSPDGERVVTAGSQGRVYLWEAATGREIAELDYYGYTTSVEFAPAGQRFVTLTRPYGVQLWDGFTGEHLRSLTPDAEVVESLAFDRAGNRLLITPRGSAWQIVDAETGEVEVSAPGSGSRWAGFSPDERRVLSVEAEEASLWDAETGAELAPLHGHTLQISSASFTPAGDLVVTASWDETLRLWDGHRGAELAVLRGHLGRIYEAEMSPSGDRVIAASMDGTARIFPVRPAHFVSVARAMLDEPADVPPEPVAEPRRSFSGVR